MEVFKDIEDEATFRQFKIVSDELESLKAKFGKLVKHLVVLQSRIEELEENKNGK